MSLFHRRPSIAFTLSVVCVLLLIPFLGVSAAQWRDSSRQVEHTHHVLESSQRLDVLLRIPYALNNEVVVVGWRGASAEVFNQVPRANSILNFDTFDTVSEAHATTDALIAQVDEPHLAALIEDARNSLNTEPLVPELSDIYGPAVLAAQRVVDEELIALNAAASATGDATITRSTRIAEAVSELQLSLIGMDGNWASMAAEEFFSPTSESVLNFSHQLVAYRQQTQVLEASLPPSGQIRDRWTELNRSPELQVMLSEYQATARRVTRDGVDLADGPTAELDVSTIDFAEAMRVAGRIARTFEAAHLVNQRLDEVLNATVENIEIEADRAAGQAEDQQRSTILWLLAAATLFAGAVLGVALLIGRPVRRMANAARRLSEGDLDVLVPERGPSEVQIGSRALNNAMTSLRTAEAQAVALAEERLDDPVLDQSTPGSLGASLQAAVGRLADSISDRDRIQRELEYEASHDGLTKLANRRAVLQHLEASIARADRADHHVALLFVDMDDFKDVNDSHGHYFGDTVLRTVADRLTAAVRSGDLAGRLGGDEFVVVAEPIANIDEAVDFAERILDQINQPVLIDGSTIFPQSSIGIAISGGALTADEVLRDADLAVYRAKRFGKGRVHVCDEDLREEINERVALEEAIVQGMALDEFELHYQPMIRAADGEVKSLEALVRWNHPTRGLLEPGEFIPTAERSDLINELDRWVLWAAGKQLEEWANADSDSPTVSVNISARHLGSGTLTDAVANVLDAFDFDPNRLELEVTETALLNDMDVAATELSELREFGVRIALDDFGTGYMSLGNLRSLPVDVMKIDRSFVGDLDNTETRSLIKLLIDTGHLLNISVTAEGVETAQQVDEMRSLGVDALQGFYFAGPMSVEKLTAWSEADNTERLSAA